MNFAKSNCKQPTNRINGLRCLFVQLLMKTSVRSRLSVLHAGGNGRAAGKSPADAGSEFQALAERMRAVLPPTKIVAASLKPSIRRWAQIEAVRAAHAGWRAVAAGNEQFAPGAIAGPLLGAVGHPWAELFVADGLRCSAAGHAIWAERLAPHLD